MANRKQQVLFLTVQRGTLFAGFLACVICALRALQARRRPQARNALQLPGVQLAGKAAARGVDAEDPAEMVAVSMLGSPFLIASAAFAGLGTSWVTLRVLLRHPWLLAFCASGCCFGLHTFQVAYQSGRFHHPIRDAEDVLDKPLFDSMHRTTAAMTQYAAKWARVILLCSGDLDEAQSEQLLNELDEDFVYDVFQRPSREWLPDALQVLLFALGRPTKAPPHTLSPSRLAALPSSPRALAARSGNDSPSHASSCRGSVASVLELLKSRDLHGGSGPSSSALQRVFTARVTSLTMSPGKDIVKEQASEAIRVGRELTKDFTDKAREDPWKAVRSAVGLGVRIPVAAGRLGAGAAYNRFAPDIVKSTVDMASRMRDGDTSPGSEPVWTCADKFGIENSDFAAVSAVDGATPDIEPFSRKSTGTSAVEAKLAEID